MWSLKCNICYEAGKFKKSLMATELGLLQHKNMVHNEFVSCPFETCNAQVGRLSHHLATEHPEFYNQVGSMTHFLPFFQGEMQGPLSNLYYSNYY